MSTEWSDTSAATIVPARAASSADVLAMHLNELPYPADPAVVGAARDGLDQLQRYPDRDARELRMALAEAHGLAPDWITVAAGSVAVIRQVMAVAEPGEVIIPWPGFDALTGLAVAAGHRPVSTELHPRSGACDLAEIGAHLDDTTSVVVVTTPHSPTGGVLTRPELSAFLDTVPEHTFVIIDRAYAEFEDRPDQPQEADLVSAHPRTVVTRTFSKAYGLAGLRVGYGIAQPDLVAAIDGHATPFAVTRAAEAAAIRALRQPDRLRQTVALIRAERVRLATGLRARGVPVRDGHGNFVWVPQYDGLGYIVRSLNVQGVQVKHYDHHGVRVTVGTAEDTDRLLQAWDRAVCGDRDVAAEIPAAASA